jgi:simple sugar transport system permease protein
VKRWDFNRLLPVALAPLAALLFAGIVSSIALIISDRSPADAFTAMMEFNFGPTSGPESWAAILDRSVDYYIAALAVAVGFRMGLFNIGTEGQSRLGAMLAAVLGGAAFMDGVPGALRIILMLIVAMAVGAVWAAIAAVLKATRGVSEVISTIMLNAIAGGIVAYLMNTDRLAVQPEGSNNVSTRLLPENVWMPNFALIPGTEREVTGFIFVAVALGVAYWFVTTRTRFGFDLKASGLNPFAARASGVNATRMMITTMLISGAIAGLVNMPQVLSHVHAYTLDIAGVGFTGIGIALLGRNHPVGIALASILWAFLERSKLPLSLADIPPETVTIMQGVTLFAVVVAYELANRISKRRQLTSVGAATGDAAVVTPHVPAAIAAKAGVDIDSAEVDTNGTEAGR